MARMKTVSLPGGLTYSSSAGSNILLTPKMKMQCRTDSVTMVNIIVPNVMSFLTDGDDTNYMDDDWSDEDECDDDEDNEEYPNPDGDDLSDQDKW